MSNKPITVNIPVTGLTCAGCVNRATTAINSVAGVSEAHVNLAANNAQLAVADAQVLQQVSVALEQRGYPTRQEQLTLQIDGMHCASCVNKIQKQLLAIPGVLEANVNLATNTVQLSRIEGLAALPVLTQAIASVGYQAKLLQEQLTDTQAELEQAQQRLARKFLWALLLALPVFLLEMGGHLIHPLAHWLEHNISFQANAWFQFTLTTILLLGPGRDFFRIGLPNLWRLSPDMNSLVALGTLAAWSYSSISTFMPHWLPSGSQHLYFESAAVIITLILLGRFLEGRAKGRTGAAIQQLLGLQVKTVRVNIAQAGESADYQDMPLAQLQTGMQFLVRPGERIAADALVVTGESWVDEAMLSGEPMPVAKQAGSRVTGGTLNGNAGALVCEATAVGEHTVLANIVRMVQQAQSARLPIQALVDKVTAVFVPVVLGIALLTAVIWLWLGTENALSYALINAVAVLIIACPCAMGLATPVSIMVGTGRAAELGILFRQGDALQQLQHVKAVAFDKTGTLTTGQMQLTDLHCFTDVTESQVLTWVAALEQYAEHPLAQALLAAAAKEGLTPTPIEQFKALNGLGVSGILQDQHLLLGNALLMQQHQVSLEGVNSTVEHLADAGKTVLYLAVNQQLHAVLAVADQVRADSVAAITQLQQSGIEVVMITGDNQKTASAVAKTLGITTVLAEVLPEGKQQAVTTLQQRFGKVAFVGDGINDAPALAAADVGIAIGSGTDIAIEAAAVILQRSEIHAVSRAFALSKAVMRNIQQNLFWAFAYNIILIPVAAGVLYPVNGILLAPGLAAAAMALSSVFVLTNALRLKRF